MSRASEFLEDLLSVVVLVWFLERVGFFVGALVGSVVTGTLMYLVMR